MHILFPADYFSPKQPDEMYLPQAKAFATYGLTYATVNLDDLKPTLRLTPPPAEGETVLYRGWMLSAAEYEQLEQLIIRAGGIPYTPKSAYLLTHHLPNWYPLLKDLTPETKIFSVDHDLKAALSELGWERYFIKNYVKSLKTSVGSIISSPDQIDEVIREMEAYRGTIEGGICVRRVEDFIVESEVRYFVVKGQPCSRHEDEPIPDIVKICAERIQSDFYSVDVVKTETGRERIVEIGDGQVSDIVGWSAERLAEVVARYG